MESRKELIKCFNIQPEGQRAVECKEIMEYQLTRVLIIHEIIQHFVHKDKTNEKRIHHSQ